VETFPATPGTAAEGRLVVLDWATRLFIPYHPSDIMMFGYVGDLVNYWRAPLSRAPASEGLRLHADFEEKLQSFTPEPYLCRHYLEKIGRACDGSIADWWRCLSELFVVVDRPLLEHFWPKYNYAWEHRLHVDENCRNEAVCGFREWLGIMCAHKQPLFDVSDLLRHPVNGPLRPAA
jgi:hypothetical protein